MAWFIMMSQETIMKRAAGVSSGVIVAALCLATTTARVTSQATRRPVPTFQVDPFWPKPLPNDWLVGNVVGVAVDSHDNVWLRRRPRRQAGGAKTRPVLGSGSAGNRSNR